MDPTRTGHVHVMKDGPELLATFSVILNVKLAPKKTQIYA